MVEDNTTVYSNIRDVQDEYDTKLSSNSHIVVILENPENGNEIGKLRYNVSYDDINDTLTLKGLVKDLKGDPYNTLIRFKNMHLGIGIEYSCNVRYVFKLELSGDYSSESE